MSAARRLVLVLGGCAWALAALAQAPSCADLEKALAAQPPLVKAATLVQADCIAGDKDAAPVAKTVLRLVALDKDGRQEKKKKEQITDDKEKEKQQASAAQELGETPQILERALGEIAAYVADSTKALPDDAADARKVLGGLAGEIEAVRKTIAQRLPLDSRDTKGWDWDGNRRRFPGLPAFDPSPLDGGCAQPGDTCARATEAAKIVMRAGKLVNRSLAFSDRATYQEALAAARLRDAKWTSYFDEARLQLPLELALNGWLHGLANRAAGGFADVPTYQWILLHPEIGMEYVRGAEAGSRLQPALVIEVIGYNRWSWSKEGKMENALGVSFIGAYSDRAGISSVRPGVMVHLQNKYAFAYTRNSGKNGFILSVDLAKLVTRVQDEERSDFRLKETGRTGN